MLSTERAVHLISPKKIWLHNMERSLGTDALLEQSWSTPWLDDRVFPYWPEATKTAGIRKFVSWLASHDKARYALVVKHAFEFERVYRLVTGELTRRNGTSDPQESQHLRLQRASVDGSFHSTHARSAKGSERHNAIECDKLLRGGKHALDAMPEHAHAIYEGKSRRGRRWTEPYLPAGSGGKKKDPELTRAGIQHAGGARHAQSNRIRKRHLVSFVQTDHSGIHLTEKMNRTIDNVDAGDAGASASSGVNAIAYTSVEYSKCKKVDPRSVESDQSPDICRNLGADHCLNSGAMTEWFLGKPSIVSSQTPGGIGSPKKTSDDHSFRARTKTMPSFESTPWRSHEDEDEKGWLCMRDPMSLREFWFDPETRAAEWKGGGIMSTNDGTGLGLLSEREKDRLKRKFERRRQKATRRDEERRGLRQRLLRRLTSQAAEHVHDVEVKVVGEVS